MISGTNGNVFNLGDIDPRLTRLSNRSQPMTVGYEYTGSGSTSNEIVSRGQQDVQ